MKKRSGLGESPSVESFERSSRLHAQPLTLDLPPSLPEASVDGMIVSQLIEHLPNDRALAREIARVLKPTGWWYAGHRAARDACLVDLWRSVRWLLDPTHVRAYRSAGELLAALDHPDLEIVEVRVSLTRSPLADLLVRVLNLFRVFIAVHVVPRTFREHYVRSRLAAVARRHLQVGVAGYWLVEVTGTRR